MPQETGKEMAQPNVAREPSMDEILASIRKIIENNETQPELADFERGAEDFRVVTEIPAEPAVAAFHVEEAVVADVHPLHRDEPVSAPQPALSLADVAARVRAASERHVANRMGTPVEQHAEPEAIEIAPVEIDVEPEAEAVPEAAALVSPAVGERVAQSFGALAEALDAGPRRSFDAIAEDMLRPMLREWLDDNLPTLVERLVREEIERVARGPRR